MPTAPAPRLRLRVPRYALDLPIETLPDLAPATREAARRLWKTGAARGVAGQEGASALAAAADDREGAGAALAARLDAWRQQTWRDHLGPPLTGGRSIALIVKEYGARTKVELAPEAAHSAEQA